MDVQVSGQPEGNKEMAHGMGIGRMEKKGCMGNVEKQLKGDVRDGGGRGE